jgi:glycosyltransferase involved in cell wall biosynthesis
MGTRLNACPEEKYMKKIAFLLNDLGMGGAERCAVIVAQEFAQRGHAVSLVLLRGATNFWGELSAKIKVIDLSADFQGKRFRRWWQALTDIADTHDVLIGSNILVPTYVMYLLGRTRPCKMIAWVHGPMAEIHALTPFRWFHRLIGRWIYRQLNHIVFVSQHAQASMGRWLNSPLQAGWQVIYNFVPAFNAPAPRKALHTPVSLLFIGRLSPEKSPVLLVQTVAKLMAQGLSVKLTVVGEGEELDRVKAAIVDYKLIAYIDCVGSQHAIQPYLAAADFLLLPSQFEGCPLVVLEAMQSGVPVVATKAGGVPELLGPLDNQCLVEPDADRLAQAIIQALADYPLLSQAVLKRSQAFTASHMMPRWEVLLGERDE